MAKINPINGKMAGKIGGVMYQINHGLQIVKEKPLVVANPNTNAQVQVRAKLKLLSQLSSALAPVIAIKRDGILTPRNQFTSRNYGFVTVADNIASMPIEDVQLTKGAIGLAGIVVERDATKISVELTEDMHTSINRVVYIVLQRTSAGGVTPAASIVQSVAGADGLFAAELPLVEGLITVHAYGIRDNSAQASAAFGNMSVPSADAVAQVIASRNVKSSDFSLTETRGVELLAGDSSAETGNTRFSVALSAHAEGGSFSTSPALTGAGRYEEGAEVTVTAPASAQIDGNTAPFEGWYNGATKVSNSTSYTFTMGAQSVSLVANFVWNEMGDDH